MGSTVFNVDDDQLLFKNPHLILASLNVIILSGFILLLELKVLLLTTDSKTRLCLYSCIIVHQCNLSDRPEHEFAVYDTTLV